MGAVRERAAEGSLLFDEAEKAHPRVLDILLQLLDAARVTVATGQTLDFAGFYIWLTSNIGAAELISLQHSSDAVAECLLNRSLASGMLMVDESRDCLIVC